MVESTSHRSLLIVTVLVGVAIGAAALTVVILFLRFLAQRRREKRQNQDRAVLGGFV